MPKDITQQKKELRRQVLSARRSLSDGERNRQSQAVLARLTDWDVYITANTVMLFLSMPDELATQAIIEDAWQRGKTVCVPRMEKEYGYMKAATIRSFADVSAGRMGIWEPRAETCAIVEPAVLDLIIVPGVAFDRTGGRCGMGAGYYDRFLPQASQAILAGAALSCQLVPQVPQTQEDYPLDYLITAEELLAFTNKRQHQ